MQKVKPEITQEEKVATLKISLYLFYPLVVLTFLAFATLKYFLNFPLEMTHAWFLLFLCAIIGVIHHYLVLKGWLLDFLYYFSLTTSVGFVVVLLIHYTGGIATPLILIPLLAIAIEGAAYPYPKLIYTVFLYSVFVSFLVIFEYFGLIESIIIIEGLNLYKYPFYVFGYLTGILFLYISVGIVSAIIGGEVRKQTRIAEQGKADFEKKTVDLLNSQKATLSIMADLNRAKGELEKRVVERTAELEEAKTDLERKVTERTEDLDKSRKAILHMMKNLKQDITKLQAVDRMKTEFLAVISHELRTPLTPIKGYISMFLGELYGKLAPQYKRAAGIIQKQSDHLLGLIDSVLDVSRLERGVSMELKKEPVSVRAILDELMEAMQPQFEARQIKTKINLPKDLPTMIAEPNKIRRLLTNLLGNALKFTPLNGYIEIIGIKEDGTIQLQVIDNGIGLEKDRLEKIFDKFYQVDGTYTRAAGGVGLGLTIAKEIVEAHGGKIWAESEGLGRGTKFCFTLPVGGG